MHWIFFLGISLCGDFKSGCHSVIVTMRKKMAIIPLKNYPNMAINQKWTSKSIFNHPSTYMHPSIHPSSIHGLHTLITKLKNLAIFTFFFPSHLAIETLGSRLFHFLISGFFNFAFWRNFASKNKTLTRMSRVG